ncbi:hypothetical protein Tco_1048852 [Tanacetum coccineum]
MRARYWRRKRTLSLSLLLKACIHQTHLRYGYIKNHKKTVKKRANTDTRNGRVQESQRFKAKVKESQLQSTMGQQKSTH